MIMVLTRINKVVKIGDLVVSVLLIREPRYPFVFFVLLKIYTGSKFDERCIALLYVLSIYMNT